VIEPKFDQLTAAAMQLAMSQMRQGNLSAAKVAVLDAIGKGGNPLQLHELLGLMLCRHGAFEDGAKHLRAAFELSSGNLELARNLATALIDSGDLDAAVELCSQRLAEQDPTGRLWRIRAFALHELERFSESAEAYHRVVDAFPEDFEAWNNLGNTHALNNAFSESVAALRKALSLQPNNGPVVLNCAASMAAADMFAESEEILLMHLTREPEDYRALLEVAGLKKIMGNEVEALEFLRRAVAVEPANPDLWLKLGTELQSLFLTAESESALRKALALDAKLSDAYLLLALLYEHTNRPIEMRDLLAEAERFSSSTDVICFLRAMVLWREKKYEEGLRELEQVSETLDPIRTAHLRGQFLDRQDRPDEAFEYFSKVNELHKDDPSKPLEKAEQYRRELSTSRQLLTEEWLNSWSPPHDYSGRTPVFLVGFPRSGTTLLDTLLMGHPEIEVLEERPTVKAVEVALGSMERLASLTPKEIEDLRDVYFTEAQRWTPLLREKLLVDKSPLYLNKLPYIIRLFPQARFIFSLRHPMDVLLSCYMTNFRLNAAMSNFLTLETAGELYDATFAYWEKSVELMKPDVFTLRYERLVADKAQEVRSLFNWLGVDWEDDVLDHQKTAKERGVITTASYSQVTEPIYTRSLGRWRSYQTHLADLAPKIGPWAARFGYQD